MKKTIIFLYIFVFAFNICNAGSINSRRKIDIKIDDQPELIFVKGDRYGNPNNKFLTSKKNVNKIYRRFIHEAPDIESFFRLLLLREEYNVQHK